MPQRLVEDLQGLRVVTETLKGPHDPAPQPVVAAMLIQDVCSLLTAQDLHCRDIYPGRLEFVGDGGNLRLLGQQAHHVVDGPVIEVINVDLRLTHVAAPSPGVPGTIRQQHRCAVLRYRACRLSRADQLSRTARSFDTGRAAQASVGDPAAVVFLLEVLREAGATGQVAMLASRAAAQASLDDPAAVVKLLDELQDEGATGQLDMVLGRDPAAQANLDNPAAVAKLLDALREASATGQVTTLLDRAAAQASLDDPYNVAFLLDALHKARAPARPPRWLAAPPVEP